MAFVKLQKVTPLEYKRFRISFKDILNFKKLPVLDPKDEEKVCFRSFVVWMTLAATSRNECNGEIDILTLLLRFGFMIRFRLIIVYWFIHILVLFNFQSCVFFAFNSCVMTFDPIHFSLFWFSIWIYYEFLDPWSFPLLSPEINFTRIRFVKIRKNLATTGKTSSSSGSISPRHYLSSLVLSISHIYWVKDCLAIVP